MRKSTLFYFVSQQVYYIYIDGKIGELIDLVDKDTFIMIVSDHGAKKMDGGICINEWLIKEGYLTIRDRPDRITPLREVAIDWGRTKAWGEGGYYGRLFLNVKGREPQGVIDSKDYEKVRDELVEKLEGMTNEEGTHLNTVVYKPQDVYKEVKNIPPDLIIYFGNLNWRSVGSLGIGNIYTYENDTGPDDANHDQYGIFVLSDREKRVGRELEGLEIMDIAATILHYQGMKVPQDMQGKIIEL